MTAANWARPGYEQPRNTLREVRLGRRLNQFQPAEPIDITKALDLAGIHTARPCLPIIVQH